MLFPTIGRENLLCLYVVVSWKLVFGRVIAQMTGELLSNAHLCPLLEHS